MDDYFYKFAGSTCIAMMMVSSKRTWTRWTSTTSSMPTMVPCAETKYFLPLKSIWFGREFLIFFHQYLFSIHRAFFQFQSKVWIKKYIFFRESILFHIRAGKENAKCRACWSMTEYPRIFPRFAYMILHTIFPKIQEIKYPPCFHMYTAKCGGCLASFPPILYISPSTLPKPREFALGGGLLYSIIHNVW